jgi:hypothetical protein
LLRLDKRLNLKPKQKLRLGGVSEVWLFKIAVGGKAYEQHFKHQNTLEMQ